MTANNVAGENNNSMGALKMKKKKRKRQMH